MTREIIVLPCGCTNEKPSPHCEKGTKLYLDWKCAALSSKIALEQFAAARIQDRTQAACAYLSHGNIYA